MSEPLKFDLSALRLSNEPTIAIKVGLQQILQHSWCGTVVVRSHLAQDGPLGTCPSCDRPTDPWWQQQIDPDGLAGLNLIEPRR
ncbi:hypothetical protein [Leucobacter sp. GX0328]